MAIGLGRSHRSSENLVRVEVESQKLTAANVVLTAYPVSFSPEESTTNPVRTGVGVGTGAGGDTGFDILVEEEIASRSNAAVTAIGFCPDSNQGVVATADGDDDGDSVLGEGESERNCDMLRSIAARGLAILALVLDWLDSLVADVLLSPLGRSVASTFNATVSNRAYGTGTDILYEDTTTTTPAVTEDMDHSLSEIGSRVIVDFVDWFDATVSNFFTPPSSTASNSSNAISVGNENNTNNSVGLGGCNVSNSDRTAHTLGVGVLTSIVESLLVTAATGVGVEDLVREENTYSDGTDGTKDPVGTVQKTENGSKTDHEDYATVLSQQLENTAQVYNDQKLFGNFLLFFFNFYKLFVRPF